MSIRSASPLFALAAFAAVLSAQNPPAPPKPGPEQQKLAFFAGRWTSEGEMKPGPMGPGGKVSGTDVCEWFQGGFHLVCRSEGSTAMGATKSMGILGYDTERKRYTYYGVDNSGMGGQPLNERYVVKVVSPDSYTFEFSMQMGSGPWAVVMTGTETRVK